MSSDFLTDSTRKMLADSFGILVNDPRMDAAMDVLYMAKRDSDIYELSATVPAALLAIRYGLKRDAIHKIIRQQLSIRREHLRAS